jgi:superoxide reductase
MQRREFLAAAGVGAGVALAGKAVQAKEKGDEKQGQIYQCEECGAIVEVVEPGTASLVHCNKPMKLLQEVTEGEGAAKHLPVIEKIEGGYKVKVGSAEHPMQKAHHIAWIELIADGRVYRQHLEVGAKPEAIFLVDAQQVSARAHCNLHGLWRKQA